ncbi:MAG: hypothetical protein AAB772_03175 [Patescibacteria group bacterium]
MKMRWLLALRVLITILVLGIAAFVIVYIAAPAENGLTFFKEKDKIIYKIDLTVDLKKQHLCVLLHENRDIQEVYNIVILNSDKFPVFPDNYKVDDSGNIQAYFRLSAVSDNFSVAVIKFDNETLAADIEFPNINLALIPGIKDF